MVPASFARQILDRLPLDGRETGRPGEASSHDAPGAAVHSITLPVGHCNPGYSRASGDRCWADRPKAAGRWGHCSAVLKPDQIDLGLCNYCASHLLGTVPPTVADRQASQPAAPVTASAPVAGAPPRNHQIGEITRMTTTKTLLDRVALDTSGLDDLVADIEVPALSTPQRQGDVGIFPRDPLTTAERSQCDAVPGTGVAVVRGESTGGNAHILLADGPVMFGRRDAGVLIGILDVPEESTAHLIHTEEHSAISIAPGTYRVHGKREQADEIRRVAD